MCLVPPYAWLLCWLRKKTIAPSGVQCLQTYTTGPTGLPQAPQEHHRHVRKVDMPTLKAFEGRKNSNNNDGQREEQRRERRFNIEDEDESVVWMSKVDKFKFIAIYKHYKLQLTRRIMHKVSDSIENEKKRLINLETLSGYAYFPPISKKFFLKNRTNSPLQGLW
jgi:hypothetical protein